MKIKQQLQEYSRRAKMPYAQVVTLYAMERFLYRLSISRYAEKFFLKGGMLLMGMGITPARTTMDIDLLGRIDNSLDNIRKVIKEIVSVRDKTQDGLFLGDKLTVTEIMLNAAYHGVRVEIPAHVGSDSCTISIDIGFSDEIIPAPCTLAYPSLLAGMPECKVRCYSRESIVAEKWQSLVQLGGFSNRMKDFYDLWFLAHNYKFDFRTLSSAVRETFERRNTGILQFSSLLTQAYLQKMQPRWATYLSKLKSATFARKPPVPLPPKDLETLMDELVAWLQPPMLESREGKWIPGSGWRYKN